jgi:hypothetical protein
MICFSKAVRKVRCHNGSTDTVDKLLVAVIQFSICAVINRLQFYKVFLGQPSFGGVRYILPRKRITDRFMHLPDAKGVSVSGFSSDLCVRGTRPSQNARRTGHLATGGGGSRAPSPPARFRPHLLVEVCGPLRPGCRTHICEIQHVRSVGGVIVQVPIEDGFG